ncbi:MAG: phosphatidate cytidylyltransferase [Betaproteobacteria bacterium]
MLRQRIITAVLMLAIFLPALFYAGPWAVAGLCLVLLTAGAWEWGRLNHLQGPWAWAMGLICLLACALSWWAGWLLLELRYVWSLAAVVWVLGGMFLLARGVPAWGLAPIWLRCLLGLLLLWAAWLAVAQARLLSVNFLLSVLTLVWMADVAAYFAGKAWGGRWIARKLAAQISPGKSWEGAIGGVLGVLVLGLLWSEVELRLQVPLAQRSVYGQLLAGHGLAVMVLAMIFLSAMSVVGDLLESLLKRSAGVKDSSGLLPGHGGVLDRVDALLPVLPLAMMLAGFSRFSA